MPADTRPPQPRTGYAHPACYAGPLGDCDETLSREHYISKKLLDRLGPMVTIQGAAWCLDKPRTVSPQRLTAKVLCKRHNEALSVLDDRITDLFDSVFAWQLDKPVGERVLDGEDVERWFLKVLFGWLISGNAAHPSGQGSMRAPSVPHDFLRVLFGEAEMFEGGGLYLIDRPAEARFSGLLSLGVATVPLGQPFERRTAGLVVSFVNVVFLVSVVEVRTEARYRPTELELEGSGTLRLRWNSPHDGSAYVIKKREHTE